MQVRISLVISRCRAKLWCVLDKFGLLCILPPQATARTKASRHWRLWPGLQILKARAIENQAKAVAFRPSRAGTPLFADAAAHSIWTFVAILADFVSITHMVHDLSQFFDPTVRKVLLAIYECLELSADES